MDSQVILQILLDLGLILVATKWLGTLVQKIGFPQVAGQIIAGLLLRFLPPFANFGVDGASVFINAAAEIGVIMIMFSAGLGTNIKMLLKSGFKATLIAAFGVLVPLVAGCAMALCFWPFKGFESLEFYKALFIGTILTATSVSISVAALKELGVISSSVGQTIVSAAIIDDVFGIIVLTLVIGVAKGGENVGLVLLKTALFFVASVGVGAVLYRLFKWYDTRHLHTHRIAIYGLAAAFIFSYCAEKIFGIADITGAYVAGVIFCNLQDAQYMEKKVDVGSFMLFSPVFFASIGLKTTFAGVDAQMLLFALCFVVVGCVAKIIGCGGIAKLLGFKTRESFEIGVGMMVRGEVALIVAQKGLACGLVERQYFTPVILLIIVSSVIVPILLKALFKKTGKE